MKTERQRTQNQNERNSKTTLTGLGGQYDNRVEDPQKDFEKASPLEASYILANVSGLHANQPCLIQEKNEGSFIPSNPVNKPSDVGNKMTSAIDPLDIFDGPWRSPTSSDLASVSDVIERKLSSGSIESDILNSSLDFAPSLDEVFDVLDEMDSLESILDISAPLTTPPAHLTPRGMFKSEGLLQLPNGSHPSNSFEGFNFGLVKGLQNPSRGLITAMRKLCDLLSKPRSDHLESVFVRLLNKTLSEMEDATQPQSKRPRRNNESLAVSRRHRKRPNKSTSDVDGSFHSTSIRQARSFASKTRSLPIISTRPGRCTETVDLTGLEDSEKKQQQDSTDNQKEPFIALEDTMSVFMSSLPSIATKQEK